MSRRLTTRPAVVTTRANEAMAFERVDSTASETIEAADELPRRGRDAAVHGACSRGCATRRASSRRPKRVPREERGQRLGHRPRMLHVQQVSGVR